MCYGNQKGDYQVTVASSSPLEAAAAYVLEPQARLRMCQPASSIMGLGYMVLSPDTFSLPQAHS